MSEPNNSEEKETSRIEAFSDGVFAIAITLLVLELHVPKPAELSGHSLWSALLEDWPSYFAFVLSFFTILILWFNHHKMFTLIRRTDRALAYLNGFLLLFVCLTPWPTALIAEYIGEADERTACIIFGGTFFMIAVAYNILWRYAAARRHLLANNVNMDEVNRITKQYLAGPVGYGLGFVVAFFNTSAGLTINLTLALFFVFTGKDFSAMTRRRRG